jgi:hypothetical protein
LTVIAPFCYKAAPEFATHNYFALLLGLIFGTVSASAQSPHVPQPGSPERKGICDAARAHILAKDVTDPVPQPIVFKIDHLRVLDDYCNFEAIPLFKDGSHVAPKYMADIGLNFCLRKTGGDWKVIVDLSRTDVPDAAELALIKRRIPADFPLSLFSPTWRDLLRR